MELSQEKNQDKGQLGEEMASQYLKHNEKMTIVEKNFRCRFGEIDLIAKQKSVLVFIEVKWRKTNYYGSPVLAVGVAKQKKIIKTAQFYIHVNNLYHFDCRFDVIGITKFDDDCKIDYIPHAFLAQ